MKALERLQALLYPTIDIHLCQAGKGLEDASFVPSCCGMFDQGQQSCHVTLKGYTPAGWLLCLDGPHQLRLRQFHCRTHARVFNICDARFTEWVYGSHSPHTWQQLQPEPAFVQYGDTYYSSELLYDMVCQFESRVTVNQIVENIQQRWRGVWCERRAKFVRHALAEAPDFDVRQLPGPSEPYWERVRGGRGIMTDRSKVHDLLLEYLGCSSNPNMS